MHVCSKFILVFTTSVITIVGSEMLKFLLLVALVAGVNSASLSTKQVRDNRGQVVFLGDSITDWWSWDGQAVWEQYYAPIGAVNTGVAGDWTNTIIERINNQAIIDNLSSYLAVLKIGTNDLSGNAPEQQIANNIRTIIGLIREKNPECRVLLLGILPRGGAEISQRVRNVNALISSFADDNTIWYLDMEAQFSNGLGIVKPELYWDDQLHLSTQGYVVWAETMASLFNTVLNRPFSGKSVFLGDSITAGWQGAGLQTFNANYAPITTINVGVSGHTTLQTINRIVNEGVLNNRNSKIAVLMIGTNDLSQGISEFNIAVNIQTILDLIQARLPHVKILLLGILPRGGEQMDLRVENVNAYISAYDNGDTIRYLNMRDAFQVSIGNPIPSLYEGDLLHLNSAGYQRWHETMWPLFETLIRF